MRRATSIALACAALGLVACGDSNEGPKATGTNAVGSGATCRARLTETVTTDYLRRQGIGIANERNAQAQLIAAIATVCKDAPASLPRNKGAERVVAVIEAQYLPPEP
jgi:hypothetical protein